MNRRATRWVLAVLPGAALVGFLLGWGLNSPARASGVIRCVDPGGLGSNPACAVYYASVQAAITAAAAGDTIRVATGDYHGTITLDKSVVLEGGWNNTFTARDWNAYPTTLDGQRAGSVIQVTGGISPTIEGFVITGGDASSFLGWGGGIDIYGGIDGGGLTIVRHNVITNNIACTNSSCQALGGGITAYHTAALIESNTVISNAAGAGSVGYGYGGGVYVGWMATATLTGNLILSNTGVFSTSTGNYGDGGGVYVDTSAHEVVVRDNEVRGNVAAVKGPGRGGGIFASGDLYANRVLSNTAGLNGAGWGGGVYGAQWSRAHRCTIVDNTATRGGGVYLSAISHTELRDSLIARNLAINLGLTPLSTGGGGIASEDDMATIASNQIISNTAFPWEFGAGGGVLLLDGDQYSLQDNLIRDNSAWLGGGIHAASVTGSIARNQVVSNIAVASGGGFYLFTAASPALDSNLVISNTALGDFFNPGFGGAGLFIHIGSGVPVTLTNNIIARNQLVDSSWHGAGIYLLSGDLRLYNNDLVDNAQSASGDGVLLRTGASHGDLRNNIFVGHAIGVRTSEGATAALDYNDYFDNVSSTVNVAAGTHSRSDDPLFRNRTGVDYHLGPSSPLVNQGDASVPVHWDFDGEPRPRGAGIDIGADEVYSDASYVSAATGSDTTGDGSPAHPFATVHKGLAETGTGGAVYVGRGTYAERLVITRSVMLLGGYREGDWTRAIGANPTTLDGTGGDTTVLIENVGVHATLEGFAITGGGGSALGGGGVTIWTDPGAAPCLVTANRITNNAAGYGPSGLTGGGLTVIAPCRVVNNWIYDNTLDAGGLPIGADGLALLGMYGPISAFHNTIVDNGSSGSVGVVTYMPGGGYPVTLTNNLIVGNSIGITALLNVQGGVPAIWDHNGFWANGRDYAPGLAGGAHDVTGDPAFVSRAGHDYHLGAGSAAIDRGAALDVTTDIDDQARPVGAAPDLGADESTIRPTFVPLMRRSG